MYSAPQKKIEIGWLRADEDYRVTCRYSPGTPKPSGLYPGCSSRWVPGDDDPEIEILSVREDCAEGRERPELVDVAQHDLGLLYAVEQEESARAALALARGEEPGS